jgi:hypothetical protein
LVKGKGKIMDGFDNNFELTDEEGNPIQFISSTNAREAAERLKKYYVVEDAEPVYSPTMKRYWVRFKLAKREGD